MKQSDFNKLFVEIIRSPDACKQYEIAAEIKTNPRLEALKAISVYQEDYQARLTEALQNTYKTVYYVLGDDDFFSLANDYIKIHSSQSTNLDDYGEHLGFFITTHPLGDTYSFLSDLAHLEWSIRNIFHTNEVIGLDSNNLLQAIAANDVFIQLVSSAELFFSPFDLIAIYELQQNSELNEEEREHFSFNKPSYILLAKEGTSIKFHKLSKNQWEFLSLLKKPSVFSDIINNHSLEINPDEMENLFKLLSLKQLLQKAN